MEPIIMSSTWSTTSDATSVHHTLTSRDGTRIHYSVWGQGPRTLVLCPGLATPPLTYRYIITRFAPQWRVVTWDMRGTYRSAVPAGGITSQRVEDSVDDLEAIIDAENLNSFVIGGWSMGCQITLEFYRRQPSRCLALALINGGFEHVLKHVGHPRVSPLVQHIIHKSGLLGPLLNPLTRWPLRQTWVLRSLRALSLVAANEDFVFQVIRQFCDNDFTTYYRMLEALNEHSAADVLPHVHVPTLITTGTRDFMTPISQARVMATQIPDAELVVIPRGTHYTPLEFPHRINEALITLTDRVG